jgi:multisubunit Na+/H+ antiporter MnhF subunit
VQLPNGADFEGELLAGQRAGAAVTTLSPLYTEREVTNHLRIAQTLSDPGDLALLLSSSGTTGLPKIVQLSHRAVITSICQFASVFPYREGERVLGLAPFFHIMGLSCVLLHALSSGATVVTMPRFDLEDMLRTVAEHRIEQMLVSPPVLTALAHHPLVDSYDLSSLRVVACGAAAASAELERAAADKAKRVEQLERLGADHNAAFGGAARALFLVLFGLSWSVIVGANAFPALGLSHPTALAVSSGSALAMAGYTWFARRAMTATALNRGVIATAFIGIATYAVIEAIAWWLGLDMVTTHTIAAAAWVGACSTAAVFLDRALVVPTLGFLSTLVVCLVAPAYRQWMIAASEGVLLMTAGYVLTGGKRGRQIAGLADLLRTDRT